MISTELKWQEFSEKVKMHFSNKFTKVLIKTILGFIVINFYPKKTIVFILSTMRSGSTLLKALLAEAPEIQHTNEIELFSAPNKYIEYFHYWRLTGTPILLVKRPSNFTDYKSYPVLPKISSCQIILIRNPVDTINSIVKMNQAVKSYHEIEDIVDYWCITYDNLAKLEGKKKIVLFDDLIRYPIDTTSKLFSFIGSKRKLGTKTYSLPESGNWEWGMDDGGELIGQFKVITENRNIRSNILDSTIEKFKNRLNATYDNYLHP
ncbi:MAG: sulfotransferase [Saprospiraceae bacterium]|nr:sulfotransferase [Saprospiraceae bacterium]MCF8251422.1 sulfotransferase [Saprospiraceae bacterium]MCF8312696.1 sulfotransferase [Saprospiraceae bacterium]MCF8441038.1 sulfotransferase [Saprospiraceae bacterium]